MMKPDKPRKRSKKKGIVVELSSFEDVYDAMMRDVNFTNPPSHGLCFLVPETSV